MKYITLCVKESLRLYPAVPEILRDVETSLTFSDGRTLPEGNARKCDNTEKDNLTMLKVPKIQPYVKMFIT